MVKIRVAVADASRAHALMHRLVALFDRPSVSFDGELGEVRLRSEWGSRAVLHVISTVESWLAMDGVDSATLTIGDRSYTMLGAAGDAPSGRAA